MSWVEEVLAARAVWQRAPSAHNTQPWVLTPDADRLVLSWDPDRELVVADPTRRDLWLSLGALVEAIAITEAGAGRQLDVDWQIDAHHHRAAVLTDGGPGSASDDSFAGQQFSTDELLRRRTARGPYAATPVAESTVDDIAVAARLASTGLGLALVPAPLVEVLLPASDRWSYSSPAQVAELRGWLRLDRNHPAHRRDGLSYEALAMTALQARALRTALSPKGWAILRRLGGPALLAAAGGIDGLGTVVALHTTRDAAADPVHVAESGRALLRVWLAAGRHGLSAHPLSQLIDAPATAEKLHAALPGRDRFALNVFRIGVPKRVLPPSSRLTRFNQATG